MPLDALNHRIFTVRAGRQSTLRPTAHYYFESNKEADDLEGNTYEELRVNPFAHTSHRIRRNDHGLIYNGSKGPVVWHTSEVTMPAIGEIRMDVFGRPMPHHIGRQDGTQEIMTASIRQRMTPWYTHPELIAEARFQALVAAEQANDDASIAGRQRQVEILRQTKPTGTEEDNFMRQQAFTDNKLTMTQVFEDLHRHQEQAWRQYYADVMRTFRPTQRPCISLSQPSYDPASFDAQFAVVDHIRSVADLEPQTTVDYSSFPVYHFRAGIGAVELSKKILLRDEPPKETARNASAKAKQADAASTQGRPAVRTTGASFQPRQQMDVPRAGGRAVNTRASGEALSQRNDSAVRLSGQEQYGLRLSKPAQAQRSAAGHSYGQSRIFSGDHALPSQHDATSRWALIGVRA